MNRGDTINLGGFITVVLIWFAIVFFAPIINQQVEQQTIEPRDQRADQRPAKCLKYLNKDPDNFDKEKHQLWAECMGVRYD